jgi:hypothetical protein
MNSKPDLPIVRGWHVTPDDEFMLPESDLLAALSPI